MATKTGDYYNNGSYDVFRAKIDYSITEDTATYAKVRCRVWCQMGDGHDSGANIQGQSYVGGSYSSWVKGSGYLNAGDESGYLGDITKKISKTHSSQSVTCSGQVWGSTWDAYSPWVNATVTVSAKTKYTVSYNASSGSGAPSSQTKWHGETLALSSTTPIRTGHTFKGWATSSGGSVKYAAGANYTADSDATLYAVWQANTYSVTYDANGGSGTTASQTKTYNQTLSLNANSFTRTNYVFKEWNTKANGTGTTYAGDGTGTYTGNANLKLYAIWRAPYTVSYDANASGATVSNMPSSQTKVYGQALTLSSKSPTRSGYDFVKWNTASNGGGSDYSPGGTVPAGTNANLTLYAIWKASSPTLKVTGYYRSDVSAVADDEGNYITAMGTWSMAQTIDCTISASAYLATDTTHSTALGTNSTPFTSSDGDSYQITITLDDGEGGSYVDPDLQYDVVVTATNTSVSPNASTSSTVRLGTAYYPIDVLNHETINGVSKRGIAFGKAAETDFLADFAFPVTTSHNVSNKNAFFKSKRTDTGNAINFGVGSGGVNRGIWDDTLGRWLFYTNATGNVYLNGTAASVADDGTMTLAKPLPASSGGTGSDSYGTTKTVNVTADADAVSVATSTYVSMASLTLEKGTWLLVYNARFEPNSTGQRYLFVHTSTTNNSSMTTAQRAGGINTNAAQGSGRSTLLNASRILQVSSQATYHAIVWQNSGSTLAVNGFLRAFRLL